MKSKVVVLLLAVLALSACAPATEGGGIDIIDVSGPLDARALNFMSDSIIRAATHERDLVLLQLNSKAVLDSEAWDRLLALVDNPPVPVGVWVGPAPAHAYGGVVNILMLAGYADISPGSFWGLVIPQVHDVYNEPDFAHATWFEVNPAEDWPGVDLHPAHRQLLVALDGREFPTSNGPVIVQTLVADAETTLKRVTFYKPGLADRFFRLAVTPEAAFFFLVAGLTLLVFEFYALGPGVAAVVAGISLFLGGSGLVALPVRWWGLGLTLLGLLTLTWAYQRGRSIVGNTLGTVFLFMGGLNLIDGQGQIDPQWWAVLLSVLAVLFFYLLAMPTVQRARLSTQTIGRESLVGMTGTAVVDFSPDGLVEVGGARWRATAHREAGITTGTDIVVSGVDGLYLEVDTAARDRET